MKVGGWWRTLFERGKHDLAVGEGALQLCDHVRPTNSERTIFALHRLVSYVYCSMQRATVTLRHTSMASTHPSEMMNPCFSLQEGP